MTSGTGRALVDGERSEGAARASELARRPRLLFLSQSLPFPPDGGIHVRTYNVLRLLARAFDITALCFYRAKERPTPEAVEAGVAGLRAFGAVEAFAIPQEHSRARLLWDHFRSLVRRRAYTHYVYESHAFRRRVVELVGTNEFDLVHLDSLDLCAYVPLLGDLPAVCVHIDAQSVLLRRRATIEPGLLRRAYVAHQADLYERDERTWSERVALNVTVSELDRDTLARLAPRANFLVVPNGVDVELFQPAPGRDEQGGIVFVGGTGWFPNLDALRYFAAEILPLLRREGVTAPVRWVGRASDEERREAQALGVEMTGYVADIRPYVLDAACYVVPLRVGGGTRVKILDAWAMGKAVVSTSVGCEGLAAVDGQNILIRDTPVEFAHAVRQLLSDAELRARLGAAARRTVEEIYSWEVIGTPMLERYLALAGSRTTAHRSAPIR